MKIMSKLAAFAILQLLANPTGRGSVEAGRSKLAESVVPFNKSPRPDGFGSEDLRLVRGPKKGKGTRKSRRKLSR